MMKVDIILYSFSSCQKLKQDYAKAVYIRLLSEARSASILRIDVANRTHDISRGMCFRHTETFGNSKISKMGLKILI